MNGMGDGLRWAAQLSVPVGENSSARPGMGLIIQSYD